MKTKLILSLILLTGLSAFADDPNPGKHQRSSNENNARCVDGTCPEDKNLANVALNDNTNESVRKRVCLITQSCNADSETGNSENKRNK